jgi:hypothetical protein
MILKISRPDAAQVGKAQRDLAAGANKGNGGVGFSRSNSSQKVDTRHHGAEIVRRLPDIGEDAVRCEAEDARPTVEDLFGDIAAKADPMLDPVESKKLSDAPVISIVKLGDRFPLPQSVSD